MRHYDIILGLPCIGKTTLAQVLLNGDMIDVVEMDRSVNSLLDSIKNNTSTSFTWLDMDGVSQRSLIQGVYTGWEFISDLTDAEEHFYNHHDLRAAIESLTSPAAAILHGVVANAAAAEVFITHSPLAAALLTHVLMHRHMYEYVNTFVFTLYMSEYLERWDVRQRGANRKTGQVITDRELEDGWYTSNDYMVHLIDWIARKSKERGDVEVLPNGAYTVNRYWYVTLKRGQYILDWFEKNSTESVVHEYLMYEEYVSHR